MAFASTALAFLTSYPILVKYSRKLTLVVFRKVPAESLYGLFLAIVLILAYYDAGIAGIFGALAIALVSRGFMEVRYVLRSSFHDVSSGSSYGCFTCKTCFFNV